MSITILTGDWIEQLKTLPDKSVHCCVTSPPYWSLRDYQMPGQLGLETTPEEYVAKVVAGFAEVRRVLRDDATAWVNLGDCYCSTAPNTQGDPLFRRGLFKNISEECSKARARHRPETPQGLKPKDLVGIPWRVAFALQDDGWYLRSDIIWSKPNPMPESVTDRPTKAHEYIFLLTKGEKYFYDAEAIKERAVSDHDAGNGFEGRQGGAQHLPMSGGPGSKEPWKRGRTGKNAFRGAGSNRESGTGPANREGRDMSSVDDNANGTRNKRTVWTVATAPYKGAHFATFPPDLIKPCILAGCPVGGTVLDPFFGSGTTGMVSLELGRNCIGIDLNPEYVNLSKDRTNVTPGLALS